MKPDWKDAPEWANYLAMDEDGEWFWHEKEPTKFYDHWYSAGYSLSCSGWEHSLEQRPVEK